MTITAKKPLSIFDLVGTDVAAEEDGRWFHDIYGTADKEAGVSGVDVKLRRLSSKASQKVRQRIEKDARVGMNRTAPLPEAVLEKLVAEHLARGVILDWRGVIGADGEEIPFSPETALELLVKLPNLRASLLGMSHDMDNFRTEQQAQVEGN